MSDKVKCPICGTMREFEQHPTDPTREIAYCDCRGTKVGVVDQLKIKLTKAEIKAAEKENE